MIETTGWGASVVGQTREDNQDAIEFDDSIGVYAVADGMGGQTGGRTASRLAIQAFSTHVRENHALFADAAESVSPVEPLRSLMRDAVLAASAAVHEAASSGELDLLGMGTTLTAVVHANGFAVIGHVGDSRAYLYRDGHTHQLTSDHTFAAELVRLGLSSVAEADNRSYAQVLSRALGPQAAVEVELLVLPLQAGDRLLLTSDGLTKYVHSADWLSQQFAAQRGGQLLDRLIRHANEAGGEDNISLVCVDAQKLGDVDLDPEVIRAQLSALRNVPVFDRIDFADATRLLNRCETYAFGRNDIVFEEGDERRGLVLILSGTFVLKTGPHGAPEHFLRYGDHIGVTTLVRPRAARRRLACEEPGHALLLRADELRTLAGYRPWLGVDLYRRLAAQLATHLDRSLSVPGGSDDSVNSLEWF